LNIQESTVFSIREARSFFRELALPEREATIARDVLKEINNRLRFLEAVGLGYLALNRVMSTLSGGEIQRIRLASQLGNRLAGVIYVLDEPTVGLHQRDTCRLLESLRELRDQGNTVLMVEHDRETMEAADHIVDLGPGAGERGGRVIASGSPREIADAPDSLTGRYLRQGAIEVRSGRRRPGEEAVELAGIGCHNIEGGNVRFPLGLFTVVTGVSGSGKSTLVLDVLARVLRAKERRRPLPGVVEEARGLEHVRRHLVVNQRPLDRTPRSTPATYTGAWDRVRELYARLPLAKVRGYGPGRFSFNSRWGRCPSCRGQGANLVEMRFLSDVWVTCDACKGRRFDEGTLEVRFKGRDVSEVLAMEVDEAVEFFRNQPRLAGILKTLQAVGGGYLKLGQSAATLSGGEAQRVKLARELVERREGGNLYILDEPTTGLHFEDIRKLLGVFHSLVERGNTLVVIEHQLDVVAAADWVIDLGPEGGDEGGRVVAAGTPEEVARVEESHTGRYLRSHLQRSKATSTTGA
jgi:excinuclease ABC subunit A